jgi:hypothetical protein
MALSDLDAANFELEQKVLANSIESFRRQEHGRKQGASPQRRRQPSPAALPVFCNPATSAAAAAPDDRSCARAPSPSDDRSCARAPSPSDDRSCARAPSPSPPLDASSAANGAATTAPTGSADEYPETVQELVMNGFELRKVVHAYELIGDNFDDLLAFLISNNS